MKKTVQGKRTLPVLFALCLLGFGGLIVPAANAYRANTATPWYAAVLPLVYLVMVGVNLWDSARQRTHRWIYSGIFAVFALELCSHLIAQALYWRDMVSLGFAAESGLFVRFAVCAAYSVASAFVLWLVKYLLQRKETQAT